RPPPPADPIIQNSISFLISHFHGFISDSTFPHPYNPSDGAQRKSRPFPILCRGDRSMEQTNRKPLEFKPAKPGKPSAETPVFEPQHQDFLGFVATGHSIGEAAALVGATRAAYEKWRNREEGFKAAVAAARESHRRDVACGLHGAD